MKDTAKLNPLVQAIGRGLAEAAAVAGRGARRAGTLDVLRYGRVLKARAARRRPRRRRWRTTACTTSQSVTSTLKRGRVHAAVHA